MDAKQYIEDYATREHPNEPDWLSKQVALKIKSVGGLLTEEGAIMIVAGEHGWVMQQIFKEGVPEKEYKKIIPTGYTELTDEHLDLIWETTTGGQYARYPKEPLTVRIERIYDAEKPKYGYSDLSTSAKIVDHRGNVKYFQFDNKPKFINEGKVFPANSMSDAVQEIRAALIGKTIALYSWELYKSNKGKFYMRSTAYTKFDVVDESKFDTPLDDVAIVDELYDEVEIDELEGGI